MQFKNVEISIFKRNKEQLNKRIITERVRVLVMISTYCGQMTYIYIAIYITLTLFL